MVCVGGLQIGAGAGLPHLRLPCRAVQVWNMNATTGVVGVFNLQVRLCWLPSLPSTL